MAWDEPSGDEASEEDIEEDESEGEKPSEEDSTPSDPEEVDIGPNFTIEATNEELAELLQEGSSSGDSGGESGVGEVVTIEFGRPDLEDQTENLCTHLRVSEQEAGIIMDITRSAVREKAEADGKNWGEEAVNAVANSMISMYLQEKMQIMGETGDD